MHEVRMSQINDAAHGIQISLDGKQGERSVTPINDLVSASVGLDRCRPRVICDSR